MGKTRCFREGWVSFVSTVLQRLEVALNFVLMVLQAHSRAMERPNFGSPWRGGTAFYSSVRMPMSPWLVVRLAVRF